MRRREMAIFETIIVPLDGSALAEAALPMAAAVSRVTGAKILLLRVFETMRPVHDAKCGEVIWVEPKHPRLEILAPEILEPAVSRLEQDGLPVQAVIRLGEPRAKIIDEAERHLAPVIAMASHGQGGLSRILLGSVATRVLQGAPCPVLIVRACCRAGTGNGRLEIDYRPAGRLGARRTGAGDRGAIGPSGRGHPAPSPGGRDVL